MPRGGGESESSTGRTWGVASCLARVQNTHEIMRDEENADGWEGEEERHRMDGAMNQ